jgi:hypothetical protein
MIRSFAFCVVISVAVTPTLEASGRVCFGNVGSEKYQTSLSLDATLRSSQWNSDDDNPPVSARKAIKLATAALKTVAHDTSDWRWSLDSISLEHDSDQDKWFWEANFYAPGSGRSQDYLVIFVLMDGSVIKPVPFGGGAK